MDLLHVCPCMEEHMVNRSLRSELLLSGDAQIYIKRAVHCSLIVQFKEQKKLKESHI